MACFTPYGNGGIKEQIWRVTCQLCQMPVYKNKNHIWTGKENTIGKMAYDEE